MTLLVISERMIRVKSKRMNGGASIFIAIVSSLHYHRARSSPNCEQQARWGEGEPLYGRKGVSELIVTHAVRSLFTRGPIVTEGAQACPRNRIEQDRPVFLYERGVARTRRSSSLESRGLDMPRYVTRV